LAELLRSPSSLADDKQRQPKLCRNCRVAALREIVPQPL